MVHDSKSGNRPRKMAKLPNETASERRPGVNIAAWLLLFAIVSLIAILAVATFAGAFVRY